MGYKYKLQLPDARKLSTSCYFFPSFFSSFAGPTDTMSNFPSFFSFFAIAIVSIWPMTVIFWSFRSTAMESIPTNKWLTLKYARILKVWDTSRELDYGNIWNFGRMRTIQFNPKHTINVRNCSHGLLLCPLISHGWDFYHHLLLNPQKFKKGNRRLIFKTAVNCNYPINWG